MDIFLHAADKSSDILEVDDESLDDNILEGTGAALGTGGLGSGCTHTHYPGSGQQRRWRLLTHLTLQLLSPVQHVQQQDCQLRVVQRDYILAAMLPCTKDTSHTKWTKFSTLECHEKPPSYRLTEYERPENQLWSLLFFLIKSSIYTS